MADQIEALAAGMNEEIKRQGVVIEAYVRRLAELEARLAEVANAYDVTFKRRVELEAAILPFAEFGAENVTDDGTWKSTIHREPISTWFGPSDFRALAKLKA